MESFILIVLALVFFVGSIALFLWALDRRAGTGVLVTTGIASAFAFLLLIGAFFVQPVPAGFVGVVTSFGRVQPETLKPGMNFVAPIVNSVTDVDTRVRGIPFGGPEAPFGAASKEYQDVFLTGTLNIHVDQQKAVDLFQQVGLDYDQKLVIPFFSTAIKEVVPQYAIGDILANREAIRQQAVEKLQSKLAPYGIVVDDVAIANIDFSQQYKDAVEAKQVAQQQVETERQILEQRRQQAEQARVTAQGQADATRIAAEGQAAANRLLQESLSDELIRYSLIQKLGPSINTIILPDGQSFILDPKALTPAPQ